MKKFVMSATLAACLLWAAACPASGQIANGSFESGLQNPGGGWITLTAGSTVVNGWSVDVGTIDYIGGWWPASDGLRSLDMSGLQAGQISQAIPTIPGVTYAVAFDMSGNPDGAPAVKLLTVTADGGQAETFAYDTAQSGNTRSDMKWRKYRYTFLAEADLTLLTFKSNAAGFFGPALDNVELLEGICHRNFGKRGYKTLLVSPSAIPAHINHGDTAGPCVEE